jgi:tetratricopeptide (TPR) repeat protein
LLRGEELIDRAIEIDPDYAPAWVLKAFIHSQQGDIGARLPKQAFPMARDAVNKALELDPNESAAYALSGDIKISYERDFAGARTDFERALELDPFGVDALYQAAVYYVFIGEFEKGLRWSLLAHERDPLHIPNHATLGYAYNNLGRFDDAEAILRKRIEISPESFGSYAYLANTFFFRQRYDEALALYEQEPLGGFKYAGLAAVHYLMGNQGASDDALAKLTAQEDGGWDWQLVEAYAIRGELDEAFAAMDDAYESRDTGLHLILGDRFIESLRGDPRYEAMVEKLGIRVPAD